MKKRMKQVISIIFTMSMILVGSSYSVFAEDNVVNGTQKVVIEAEDWGPVVKKAVIHLDKTIQNQSIGDEENEFSIIEKKQALSPDWTEIISESSRTILDVYTSDEYGQEVSVDSSYITIDMDVSPTMTGEGIVQKLGKINGVKLII